MKITKMELVNKLAYRARMNKSLARELIGMMFDIIKEEIHEGNQVVLPNLGNLKAVLHKPKRRGSVNGGVSVTPAGYHAKLVSSLILRNCMKDLYKNMQMERTELFK